MPSSCAHLRGRGDHVAGVGERPQRVADQRFAERRIGHGADPEGRALGTRPWRPSSHARHGAASRRTSRSSASAASRRSSRRPSAATDAAARASPARRARPAARPARRLASRSSRQSAATRPVDQDRAPADAADRGREPGAHLVGATTRERSACDEQHVVVLGQEARRRRRRRVGPRRVGQVEQLAAALVAEARAGAGAGARTPRACRSAATTPRRRPPSPGRRRRGSGARPRRSTAPGRAARPARPRPWPPTCAGPAPHAARRHLDEREEAAAGVGQGRGVEIREALGQRLRSSAGVSGPSASSLARRREHGREVDAAQPRRPLGVARQLGVEHRLHQGPQRPAVGGRDEVDRRAHHDHPDGLAPLEQAAQPPRAGSRAAATRAPCRGRAAPAPAGRPGARRPRAASRSARSSSIWRASVARFRARALSVSAATGADGYHRRAPAQRAPRPAAQLGVGAVPGAPRPELDPEPEPEPCWPPPWPMPGQSPRPGACCCCGAVSWAWV